MRDREAWGEPSAEWLGDALTDLHDGKGTAWRRTAAGAYFPDCDCHRPKGLTVATTAGPTVQSSSPAWADPHVTTRPDVVTTPEPDADGMRALLSDLVRLLKRTP